MGPNDPVKEPSAVPDPSEPDVTITEGETVLAPLTHEVDADDMFDPMGD